LKIKAPKRKKLELVSGPDTYGQGKKLWINLTCFNINPRIFSLNPANKLFLGRKHFLLKSSLFPN
jgi:hypothetical protein